jgi:hypothetical protein
MRSGTPAIFERRTSFDPHSGHDCADMLNSALKGSSQTISPRSKHPAKRIAKSTLSGVDKSSAETKKNSVLNILPLSGLFIAITLQLIQQPLG